MRNFTGLLIIGSLLLTSPASAKDLWLTGYNETDAFIVDAESIQSSGKNRKTAWVTRFTTEGVTGRTVMAYKSAVTLQEFNCASKMSRQVAGAFYDERSKLRVGQTTPDWSLPWEYVIPSSLGEVNLDFVCGPASLRATIGLPVGQHEYYWAASLLDPR